MNSLTLQFALLSMIGALMAPALAHGESTSEGAKAIWSGQGQNDIFFATLRPRDDKLLLGRYSDLLLHLVKKDSPVNKASIGISAGMFGEGHGHGMPSSPQVTEFMGNGEYLMEGVLFNMMGEWTFFLDVEEAGQRDRIRIDVNFDHGQL